MKEIQDKLKQIVVLEDRERQINTKINHQTETEQFIDDQLQELEQELNKKEAELKSKGLNKVSKSVVEDSHMSQFFGRDSLKIRVSKVEKHSLNALHRKFYTKILKQKEQLDNVLIRYNDSVDSIIAKEAFSSQTKGRSSEPDTNYKINVANHPLMKNIM